MATIQSQLRLNDGMSATLRSINTVLGMVIGNFYAFQAATGNPMNMGNLHQMEAALKESNDTIQKMEANQRAVAAATEQVEKEQRDVKRQLDETGRSADNVLGKIMGMVGAYASIQGIGSMLSTSDQMAGAEARLSLVLTGDEKIEQVQEDILAMANRVRAPVMDMQATIAKLQLQAGEKFPGGIKQTTRFVELMTKNFKISGANVQESTSAMYQLTQAMSAGKLQGDEYRAIRENAPLLAKAIEDYMKNVQKAEGSMKDWASQGMLTAEVIQAALFDSADEIEERYKALPMSWEGIWTIASNNALNELQPFFDWLGGLPQEIIDNWDKIAPILIPVVVALGAVAVAMGV